MNQSFQSPHPEVGKVSLLYDSATAQRTGFVQNFKLYYVSTCQDFFTDMSTLKKDLDDSPSCLLSTNSTSSASGIQMDSYKI